MSDDRDQLLIEIARIVWKQGISINDLYVALGIDLDDISHSDPGDVIAKLAGIFTGWQNPPPAD